MPLDSDFVLVFHGADEAVPSSSAASPAFGKREWIALGLFAAVVAGVGAGVAWSERSPSSKWGHQKGTRITRGARLDFVYADGCLACKQTDGVLEKARPALEELGVRVRPVRAEDLPGNWPVNKTPSLLLRAG